MPDQQPPQPPSPELPEQNGLLAARIRVGEQRANQIERKLSFVEQNMLKNQKLANTEIKALQEELNDVKRTIQSIEDKLILVIKELRLSARKEDIDVMRKYLELWDPIKFVTSDRVEKIVEEKLGHHEDEQHTEEEELAHKANYDSPT